MEFKSLIRSHEVKYNVQPLINYEDICIMIVSIIEDK